LSQEEIVGALEDLTKAVIKIGQQLDKLNLAIETFIPDQKGEDVL
jgi:hypothetical protein